MSGLFAILRLGLWPDEGGENIPAIVADEWPSLIDEARRQGVVGIFCEGVRRLPSEQMPPADLRVRLLLECDALERRSEHVEAVAEDLLERFRAADLAPIVQKGPSVARYYAKPTMRKSGDIDIYFPQRDFDKAEKIAGGLASGGRQASAGSQASGGGLADGKPAFRKPVTEPDGSICYSFDGVTVEHHRKFFDSKAQFDGLDLCSPEAVVLLQITHILKHALGPGIGLKQLCDYAVVTRKLLPECRVEILASCIRQAHLQRWLGRLDAFIHLYLGVPSASLLSSRLGIKPVSPEPFLKIVLQGGEFGHHNPFRTLAASPRRRKINTLRFFFRRLPFALSTAPAEWWHTFSSLIKGNLTH